jgi:hypothetical protein|nr:MAG: hypothetical protein [Lake Baikal virophage 6]
MKKYNKKHSDFLERNDNRKEIIKYIRICIIYHNDIKCGEIGKTISGN